MIFCFHFLPFLVPGGVLLRYVIVQTCNEISCIANLQGAGIRQCGGSGSAEKEGKG